MTANGIEKQCQKTGVSEAKVLYKQRATICSLSIKQAPPKFIEPSKRKKRPLTIILTLNAAGLSLH